VLWARGGRGPPRRRKWLMKKSGTSLETGSLSSPRTISCNATTVSGITTFTGGFANVILGVWGVVRSRRIVLGWLIGWLHSVLVNTATADTATGSCRPSHRSEPRTRRRREWRRRREPARLTGRRSHRPQRMPFARPHRQSPGSAIVRRSRGAASCELLQQNCAHARRNRRCS